MNDNFLEKLLETFRVEADEHLRAVSSGLFELEKTATEAQWAQIVERIYRETHSLKGAARAVNLTEIESICQSMESVFAAIKERKLAASPPLLDLLHQSVEALDHTLASPSGSGASADSTAAALVSCLEDALKTDDNDGLPETSPPPNDRLIVPTETKTLISPNTQPVATATSSPDTIRVSTTKLDAALRQTEELLLPRLASGQRLAELRTAVQTVQAWRKRQAGLKPTLRSIERTAKRNGTTGHEKQQNELKKLLEYLDAENLLLRSLEDRLVRLRKSAEHDQRMLNSMTDGLLCEMKQMHVCPCSSLLELLPRVARDLAHQQGKEVSLVIQGGRIEIDRRVLDEIKDPIIHLLRNCIDHGIETPACRQQSHKPPHGTITVSVLQRDSGKIELCLSDDGAGIDLDQVKSAAQAMGILPDDGEQSLDDQKILPLIFQSGLSTSPIITDVSGRGLGLAIVREKVEHLGGRIAVESDRGNGTTFRIVLPLMLATLHGVLTRTGEHLYVIPAVNVECIVRVPAKEIQTVENRETIPLSGKAVSLVRLGEVLGIPCRAQMDDQVTVQAVVLNLGGDRIAFQVNDVVAEQEVLVKPLGPQLVRVRNIAGATILGTGQVVPVLNVSDLMKSAIALEMAPPTIASEQIPTDEKKQSILVAEDSITSRTLLKSILESAGYQVTTAVDGVEAYTTLKTGAFDLVVSDVDMPRMSGFDLTAKIRADKQFTELPVVLVTALESTQHRERGVDVGANAYIVKSSFDQSNLLETVQRLI